jgi:hypothetical protein
MLGHFYDIKPIILNVSVPADAREMTQRPLLIDLFYYLLQNFIRRFRAN